MTVYNDGGYTNVSISSDSLTTRKIDNSYLLQCIGIRTEHTFPDSDRTKILDS